MNTTIGSLISSAVLGAPKVEEIVAAVKTYKFGDSTAQLSAMEELVVDSLPNADARKNIAATLVGMLSSDATADAKRFACRQLMICGGPESVAGIAPLLTSIELSNSARYALERIQGPEADQALLDALSKADAKSQIGIVNSLGVRKTAAAVPAIAPLLLSKDPALADAAAAALGHIGGADAVKALQGRVAGSARETAGHALLEIADQLATGGDAKGAEKIYKSVGGSPAIKNAAKRALEKGKKA